ncbi:TPA: hypothetical protein ACG1U5_002364 [Klebsiella aerogenes]
MKISSSIPNDVSHLSEREIAAMLLDLPQPFAILFEKGELNVELFAPRGNTPRQHAGVSCTDTDSMRWGTGGLSQVVGSGWLTRKCLLVAVDSVAYRNWKSGHPVAEKIMFLTILLAMAFLTNPAGEEYFPVL